MKRLAALLIAASAAATVVAAPSGAGARWWSHVEALANDQMQGRLTGSPGHRKASQYIASQFERAGLSPAGTSGFLQPVQLDGRKIVESQSRLELVRKGAAERLTPGEDAFVALRVDPAETVEAPLPLRVSDRAGQVPSALEQAGVAGMVTIVNPHTDELLALVDAGKPLPHFPLVPSLRANVKVERRQIVQQMHIEVQDDPVPARDIFVRSDQYNFIRHGIPAVMTDVGNKKGSREQRIEEAWIRTRYHAPSDDLKQPVDLQAAADFERFNLKVAETVANNAARPQWRPDSFFRRLQSGQ